jgi:hypothetical protein
MKSEEEQTRDTEFEIRKRMFEEIKQFKRPEKEELYRILKKQNEEISENRNGIFFDLMTLQGETIEHIREWIDFCKKNRINLERREKELNELANANPGMCQQERESSEYLA